MLGKVTKILGLLWFLPLCDYLTREKGILMLTSYNDKKDGLVRKAAYCVQHHITDLKEILC
jgi:hypothetical protein